MNSLRTKNNKNNNNKRNRGGFNFNYGLTLNSIDNYYLRGVVNTFTTPELIFFVEIEKSGFTLGSARRTIGYNPDNRFGMTVTGNDLYFNYENENVRLDYLNNFELLNSMLSQRNGTFYAITWKMNDYSLGYTHSAQEPQHSTIDFGKKFDDNYFNVTFKLDTDFFALDLGKKIPELGDSLLQGGYAGVKYVRTSDGDSYSELFTDISYTVGASVLSNPMLLKTREE